MELTPVALRFLLSPAALKAAMDFLALPSFLGLITPEERERGRAWLAENGYLSCQEAEGDVMAREMAFMLHGLCLEKNALIWQDWERVQMIACRFNGIYLIGRRLPVGKWMIAPCWEEEAFLREMEEALPGMKDARPFLREQPWRPLDTINGAECLRLLKWNEEAQSHGNHDC